MAKFSNSNSNTYNQLQRFPNKALQTSALASCYSVSTSASRVNGFHYYTTTGAGSKTLSPSPPPDLSTRSGMENSYSGNIISENKGEAAHTIPEECERLFCDTLSVIFLGEGILSGQESLGTGAYQVQPNNSCYEHSRIHEWVEVLDYTSDCIYRGFVTSSDDERALFIFFSECALGQGLKTGLIALFELASLPEFGCSQIVACIPRSEGAAELEVVRNLGWCGFNLTTLQPWSTGDYTEMSLSSRWIFLVLFMFPKFLLPPNVFRSRQRNVGCSAGPSTRTSPMDGRCQKYLRGQVSYIQCSRCATDLCLTSQIISKGFTGRHGRAYLVSAGPIACAVSISATSSPIESLPNTIMQKPVSRQLVTGAHTVSDISCAFCGSILGWKYVAAEEEAQRYKVGKFILETKRTMTSSSWESASYVEPLALCGPMTSDKTDVDTTGDRVEFDSQDEDECEDLFAGVWSPGLAIRRRNRKLDRHTSIFGLTP
ncbi:yippee-domain-containing protein [Aspergillus tamarii]|uniref:Yippee-domain-containing protein n=1 Tax=Aspergillus tamarii TaxID=41984 RepID=A0A5N6UCZ6_ASPTM|nr:yippee-domain-containing protein [Aspergillus tamarii]